MYCVAYYDPEISEDELQEYYVEANDEYDAERLFLQFANGNENLEIYAIGKTEK